MMKHLTLLAAACLLTTTGCVISLGGGTDSDSDSDSNSAGSTSNGGGSTSSDGSTGGTSSASASTTDAPTTDAPTTTAATTTAASTTDATSGSTGGGSEYGNCGWFVDGGYYACAPEGAPGEADPDGTFPIDCPDTLPVEGDKCDENGPVTGQGCCLPDGTNYFCDNNGAVAIVVCR